MIRESPNGATHVDEVDIPTTEYIGREEGTWGSETSQYPEEKRQNNADPTTDDRREQSRRELVVVSAAFPE